MKLIMFSLVFIICLNVAFSQAKKNKVETYFEKCCIDSDSLRAQYGLEHLLLIYVPGIDSFKVFLEKGRLNLPIPTQSVKYTNYFSARITDSIFQDSCFIIISSLKDKNKKIKFTLNPKYFLIRIAYLKRGWILEYTNKKMTIL